MSKFFLIFYLSLFSCYLFVPIIFVHGVSSVFLGPKRICTRKFAKYCLRDFHMEL